MNIFILFLLCFNFVGLINQILDNRLEVGVSFDKGLQSMGTLALSMMGFYCVGVMLVNENVAQILSAAQKIHLDPLIVFGCLLALNLGGYPIHYSWFIFSRRDDFICWCDDDFYVRNGDFFSAVIVFYSFEK